MKTGNFKKDNGTISKRYLYLFLTIIIYTFVILALTGAILPFTYKLGLENILILDLLSHFQIYYLVISIFIVLIASILKMKAKTIYATMLTIILLILISIFPYLKISTLKSEPENTAKIKIMQTNVFKFNKEYKILIQQILDTNADIIALAETTPKWQEALKALDKKWQYKIDDSRWGSHGMIVYSKYPIIEHEIKYFSTRKISNIFATIKIKDTKIKFISIHPLPPICNQCIDSRNRNFMEVAKIIKQYQKQGEKNIILAGDLNTTMFSPAYRKFVNIANLENSRKNQGIYATWPTRLPHMFRIPIDHVLHSKNIKTLSFRTLPQNGSDHLATTAILKISPQLD